MSAPPQHGPRERGPREDGPTSPLADDIADAVRACPGVTGLCGWPATYLPGRTVTGVAVREREVEVCVVARYGQDLRDIARGVRAAVAPLVPGRPVHVVIGDLDL